MKVTVESKILCCQCLPIQILLFKTFLEYPPNFVDLLLVESADKKDQPYLLFMTVTAEWHVEMGHC